MRARVLLPVVALSAIAQPGSTAESDPARDLARVRLIVVTRAAVADVRINGATVASYVSTVLYGPSSARSSQTGQTLRLSRNVAGKVAEARFDVILAGVGSSGSVVWNLATGSGAETELEVYSLTHLDRPRLVDRFSSSDPIAQFQTSAAELASRGQVAISPVPQIVLAHFYPWYVSETWNDPQLADRPIRPYSTDDQADVDHMAREARSAGIDAFVVSWQGKEAGNGFNDRRLRITLDAARRAALKVCVYTETFVANEGNIWDAPTDPRVMFEWLAHIFDAYGRHPAYLRVDGRPVIFIYAASRLSQAEWATLIARLHESGRRLLLVGDFVQSTLLETFDGEYQYTNVLSPADEVRSRYRTESLRVRTYHLLRPEGRRRIWVASVTPGYDDTKLTSRETHFEIDRLGGRTYDEQWAAAIDSGADWVVVTSWNEWWENTQIEPSVRYGTTFLDRTRVWSRVLKRRALSQIGAPR
jgi:hypothetical protein